MKGNKKILTLAVMVLLISVCFTTYAIYRASSTGTGSINAANWSVEFKKGGSTVSNNFTFGYSDIHWTTLTGYNNTIAPGSSGYIEIAVDADGSEVGVLISAALGDITGLPTGMTATIDGTNPQPIAYSATSGAMETTVRINIAWAGTTDDTAQKDGTDLAKEGASLSIPVTLTAQQDLTNHAS